MRRIALLLISAALSSGVRADAPGGVDLQLSQSIGIAAAPTASGPAAGVAGTAAPRIASGDRVSVTVYREPDLSIADAKVGPEGMVSLPLIGELHVAGLTSKALQQLVTERLSDGYLRQPNVTVRVERHQLYFIKGEVASPGGYTFVDGLTVEKAIALAGGFTERADKDDITVVRETDPATPLREAPAATPVFPGDVITVEESFF